MSSPNESISQTSNEHNIEQQLNGNDKAGVETKELHVTHHLTGWRLFCSCFGSLLSLYLVNLEITIVGTSLVSIANDLQAFEKASWVVTGYLITYTGFNIIWTKGSDIFGRKLTFVTTTVMFVAFSIGCAISQTMTQLIICRAFQGIGASGTYSMSILVIYEMVPKAKYGIYGAMIALSVALAAMTGPIFAGALTQGSTWRWVFYINLPPGVLALLLLGIGIPTGFGSSTLSEKQKKFSLSSMRRIDALGAALLLSGSLLLITALTEATIEFTWHSAATIILLVLSGLSWTTFLAWEWFVSNRSGWTEPVFPWRFIRNRPWAGVLLIVFASGSPYNVIVVSLPQRFQAISKTSVLGAGIRLIPYSATGALSSAFVNIVCSRARIPIVYFFLVGAVFNVTSLALLSTLPSSTHYPTAGYGYEVLAGLGLGTTLGVSVLSTPFLVEQRDLAVAIGAVIQFRFLAGAIGLAIASTILNTMLKSDLNDVLAPAQLEALLQTTDIIQSLPPGTQDIVKGVFSRAYNIQFKIMLGFAAAQFPATALLFRRGPQIRAE